MKTKDIFSRDWWPYIAELFLAEIFSRVSTMLCRISAMWWGVSLGNGCRFFGKTYFRKMPNGRITIGANCLFRSAFWSNSIGIKQKCILWAGKGASITIGNNCGLSGTAIHAKEKVVLGDNVMCGANVTIADSDLHSLDPIKRKNQEPAESQPVIIEDDVWLGMNVVVLKGVTIGSGAVVAANSVVTKNITTMVVVAGVPARVVNKIEI